ncbi:MAG: hypothetical protein IH586_14325, partial [Anaerolineaceae bacterium]|nr:hypothetical protein [Anaerolineaceae bacterium]
MQNDLNKHLRNALNHLYDLDYLRQSPLVSAFGFASRFDAASALQRLLLDSIESLRPTPASPLSGDRKKNYDILNFRYIQQFNQKEVAHHLGVSERQFRREQVQALDMLANHLGKKIQNRLPEDNLEPAPPPAAAVQGDWSWLKESHDER